MAGANAVESLTPVSFCIQAIQERIWSRRMMRGAGKIRTLENAVELDLDNDKYTMHGFPPSTLRHIAASSMLLKLLLPDELDDLLSTCKVRTFPEGSIVMSQGETFESNLGDTKFWALCEGAADVYVDCNLVAEIVAGQVMGEMSVVRGMPRTATVLAGNNLVAVEMTRGDLKRALAKRPEVWDELWSLVEQRLNAPVFYSSISDDAEATVVTNVRESHFHHGFNIHPPISASLLTWPSAPAVSHVLSLALHQTHGCGGHGRAQGYHHIPPCNTQQPHPDAFFFLI